MANIKSAKKRISTIDRRNAENKFVKATLSTYVKKFRKMLEEGKVAEAETFSKEVYAYIDSACSKGVIHKNKQYKPYNTYDAELSTFVCKLYRKEYRGTNFSEYARIIQDTYGITASRSTIYNFLRRGRIRSPQRKIHKKKVVEQAATTTSVKKGK